jgi:hypothetical protein
MDSRTTAFRVIALVGALACAWLFLPVPGVILAKGFDIRGLVDCGRVDVQYCRETDDIYVWTEDLGGGTRKILIDFSWIPAQIPRLSQGEYVELEIEDIDSALVAQRVISQSDPPPKVKRGQAAASPEPDIPGSFPTVTPTPTI